MALYDFRLPGLATRFSTTWRPAHQTPPQHSAYLVLALPSMEVQCGHLKLVDITLCVFWLITVSTHRNAVGIK